MDPPIHDKEEDVANISCKDKEAISHLDKGEEDVHKSEQMNREDALRSGQLDKEDDQSKDSVHSQDISLLSLQLPLQDIKSRDDLEPPSIGNLEKQNQVLKDEGDKEESNIEKKPNVSLNLKRSPSPQSILQCSGPAKSKFVHEFLLN